MRFDLQRRAEKFKRGYVRKKRWHKVLSILACITVFVTAYALMMPAVTMTGSTYDLSENPTGYNLTTTVMVNNAALSSDMTLEDGDDFSITVDWYLPTGPEYAESDSFTYSLPTDTIFSLSDTSGILYGEAESEGGEKPQYGTYSISNNVLTVNYNSAFLELSDRHSSVRADGKISITDSISVSDDGYTVIIPGLSSVNIQLKTNTGMTIEKTSKKRIVETNSTHEAWIDYTVTLTSNGTNNDVKLTDKFYIDDANPHKIGTTVPTASLNGTPLPVSTESTTAVMTTDKGDTISTGGSVQSGDPHRTTNVTINQMKSGDELVITYSAKLVSEPNAVSHSYYGDANMHNVVTAESNQCSPISDQTDDTLRMTYIDKDGGNVNGDQTKTYWRIYVCGGEYSTLTVQDILPEGSNIKPADDTEVIVYPASGKSANNLGTALDTITFAQLKAGYEVTFPESGWVMLYYECDANADCTVKNKAKIVETDKNAEYAFSHGNVSATTGRKEWLSASRASDTMSADYFDTKILNQIYITVGTESQSVNDFYFRDMTYDESGGAKVHHFPDTVNDTIVSIEMADPDTGEYSAVTDDRFVITLAKTLYAGQVYNDSLYFRFKDDDVKTGTYRIKYYTLVEHENYTSLRDDDCLITNTLYWSNGTSEESGGGTNQKWRAYSYFGKETKSAASMQNDEIVWKIGSLGLDYNLYDIDTKVTMRYENFRKHSTVSDTLPAGLEFVAAAYGNPNPVKGGEDSVTPLIAKNQDGTTTLSFPMYQDSSSVQDLYILTRYSGEYESLTEEKKFTNSVTVKLRTAENGASYEPARMKGVTAAAAIQPPVVAEKYCKYDSSTAPYAQYRVEINNAASDLIPADAESQSFELHDDMGTALSLDETTMLVNGEALSAHPEMTLEVTNGGRSFVLSGLQDETEYSITYKALVLLRAGESFTAENASNKIDIPGIDIPARDVTQTEISGVVLGSSGSAGGTYGLVRVHKVDDRTPAKPVQNAGFTIYRIGTAADISSLSSLPATGTEVATINTDADGYTDFKKLDFGVVYGIKETSVPEGYSDTSGGAMTYFGYRSWEMVRDKKMLPTGVEDLTDVFAHTFEFVNQASIELTITKTVDGASASDEIFPFTLTSTEAMIAGQGYRLSDDEKTADFSLKNGDSVTIKVYQGSELILSETKHDGYIVLIKEGDKLLANGDNAAFVINSSENRIITVHNTPGVELPSAGGVGTYFITLAGLLFIAAAFIYGYRSRPSRKR